MQTPIKKELEKLIKEHGYESMRSFARDCGMDTSNLYTNLKSKWGLSMKRAFVIANTLGVPVEQILEMFYKDEFKENRKIVKKKSSR